MIMSEITSNKSQKQSKPVANPPRKSDPEVIPPLFRKLDWLTAGVAFIVVWTIYFLTMAPELTLEDSGELVTGAVYAGIPHPPGYPVWTIYTWLWTVLVPWGNFAWRVTLAELTAAAFGCGLVALMVSRGSSMLMEGIEELKRLTGNWERSICAVSGLTAALLVGLDGYMWSESVVINRISLFGMPWLMIVLVCLLRWMYAPSQLRYLYVAMFCFGICSTIHQTLVCAAMGIELAVLVAQPRLGRDLLFGNSLLYIAVLFLKASHMVTILETPTILNIFHIVGLLSISGCLWLIIKTNRLCTEILPSLIMLALFVLGASFYFYEAIAGMSNPPMQWGYPRTVEGFFHALSRGQYDKILPTDIFNDPVKFLSQMVLLVRGITDEFNLVYALLALLPFLFIFKMQRRERAWIIGLCGIYFCVAVLLMILFNPNVDRASMDLIKVFFASSHAIVGIMVGYGLALTAAFMATHYQRFRLWGLVGGVIAVVMALYCLKEKTGELYFGMDGDISLGDLPRWIMQAFEKNQYGLPVFANLILIAMGLAFVAGVVIYKNRAPLALTLGLFALMPLHPGLSHWFTSEQRGHMFGYWFGHDMFTPPFKGPDNKPLYPEMTKDAILFGGTDPGRFCPTYMIFCESFTPHNCQPAEDQKFDRRDVYIITQNALADGTYLCYIRAHYNRSRQIDPPFFSELFHSRLFSPLDTVFTKIGDNIEKRRRTSTSLFTGDDFTNLPAFIAKLKPSANRDKLSEWIFNNLSKETQTLLARQGANAIVRAALARDLNFLLERELKARQEERALMEEKNQNDIEVAAGSQSVKRQDEIKAKLAALAKVEPLYDKERFAQVNISPYLSKFIDEKPKSHTRIRLNRLLLEEAYSAEIAKSLGGVYPDREIAIPSPEDSQRCFNNYLEDAKRRAEMKPPQLKPGEDVHVVGDRVQVSGQVAVMAINGLLTKVIFDNNPDNEFYVEESFPLDWMYPYLTPYGIIMKVNRQPLPVLTEEILKKDHDFWKEYIKRMTGDIIDYDTKVADVAKWIEQTYLRRNFDGFTGDRKFMRDKDAPKAFSKLRSSIGGVYAWRLSAQCPPEYRPKTDAEIRRMYQEANFTFLQAFALCPYSPEAVFRYVNLLLQFNQFDDALIVAETCGKLDPYNSSVSGLVSNLKTWKQQQAESEKSRAGTIQALEDEFKKNPSNFQAAFNLASAYSQLQQNSKALAILDSIIANPKADASVFDLASTLLFRTPTGVQHFEEALKKDPANLAVAVTLAGACQQSQQADRANQLLDTIIANPNVDANVLGSAGNIAVKLNSLPRIEAVLEKVTKLNPGNPEPWYDLAVMKATLNKPVEAVQALTEALDVNAKRLTANPAAPNLLTNAQAEPRFSALRALPAFQKLVETKVK